MTCSKTLLRRLALVGLALLLAVSSLAYAPAPQIAAQSCATAAKVSGARYARLMHDPQWMPWPSRMHDPGWHSGYYLDWYPETVQLWVNPRGGDGRFRYPAAWLHFLREMQPSDETAVWIARVGAGIFAHGNKDIPILNLSQLKEEPQAEAISSGGNVVKVLEVRNNSIRIEMLYFKDQPPSHNLVNYTYTPWLVTKFTSVSYDGELGNAGGIDVYFPNLAKQESGYWIDGQRVEMFPDLPFCATARRALVARLSASPYGIPTTVVQPGVVLPITEYMPRGSDVWGLTYLGWVRLVYQFQGQPVYDTSWEMETRPPIYFAYNPFSNLMLKDEE
jgi:hypothetical protein